MTALALRPATGADLDAVLALLTDAGLPPAGVAEAFSGFVVAEQDGRVVAAAGVERYGTAALLRSVVVAPHRRGTRLGEALVTHMLHRLALAGVEEVFLLTTTAEGWFPRFGFGRVEREDVPPAVRRSPEFMGACPASAAVLRLRLAGVT